MQLPNNLIEFQLDYAIVPADQKLYSKVIKKVKPYFIIVVELQELATMKIMGENIRTCIFIRPHNATQMTDMYKQIIQYFSSNKLRYIEISEQILDHILKQCEHNTELNALNTQQQQKLPYQKIYQLTFMTGYANNSSHSHGYGNSIQMIQQTSKSVNISEKRIADFVIGYHDFDRQFQPSYLEKLVSENTLVGEYIVPVTMYNGQQLSNSYSPVQMLPPLCDDPTKEHFYCNDCRPWKYYQESLPSLCVPLLIINAGGLLKQDGEIVTNSKSLVDTCKQLSIMYYQKERNLEMATASFARYAIPRIIQCNVMCKQIYEIIANIKNIFSSSANATSTQKSVKASGSKNMNDKKFNPNGSPITTNNNADQSKSQHDQNKTSNVQKLKFSYGNYYISCQVQTISLNFPLLQQCNTNTITQYVINVIHNVQQYLYALLKSDELTMEQINYVEALLNNVKQPNIKQMIISILTDILNGILKQVDDPMVVYDFDEYEEILQEQLCMHIYCYIIAGRFLSINKYKINVNMQEIINQFQKSNTSYFDSIYSQMQTQLSNQSEIMPGDNNVGKQDEQVTNKQNENTISQQDNVQDGQLESYSESQSNQDQKTMNILNSMFINAAYTVYQDSIQIYQHHSSEHTIQKNATSLTSSQKGALFEQINQSQQVQSVQLFDEEPEMVIGKCQKNHTVYNAIQLMEQFIEVTKVLMETKSMIKLINRQNYDINQRSLDTLDEITETTICNNCYIINPNIIGENSMQSQGIRVDNSEFKRGTNQISKPQVLGEDKTYGKCAVCNQTYNNYQQHCRGHSHLEMLKMQMKSAGIYEGLKKVSEHFQYKIDLITQLTRLCDTVSASLGFSYETAAKHLNKALLALGSPVVLDPADQPRANSPICRQRSFRKWREETIANCAQNFEDKLAEFERCQKKYAVKDIANDNFSGKEDAKTEYFEDLCNSIALSQYQITQLGDENVLRNVLEGILRQNGVHLRQNSEEKQIEEQDLLFQDELDPDVKIHDKSIQEFIKLEDIKKQNVILNDFENNQQADKSNVKSMISIQPDQIDEEMHVFLQQKVRNMLNLNYSSDMSFSISHIFEFFFCKYEKLLLHNKKSENNVVQSQKQDYYRNNKQKPKVCMDQLRDEINKLEYQFNAPTQQIQLLMSHMSNKQFKYDMFYQKKAENYLLDRFKHVVIPPLYQYYPQKQLTNNQLYKLIQEQLENQSIMKENENQLPELINTLSQHKKELQRILDVAEFRGIYYDGCQDDIVINKTSSKMTPMTRQNSISCIGGNLDESMISIVLLKQQECEQQQYADREVSNMFNTKSENIESKTNINNRIFILYDLQPQKQYYNQQLLDRSTTHHSQSFMSQEETITFASAPQMVGYNQTENIIKQDGCAFNDIILGHDIQNSIATFETINPAIISSVLGLLSAISGPPSYIVPAIQVYDDIVTSTVAQTGVYNSNAASAAFLSQILRNNILFDEKSQQYEHYRIYQSSSRTINRVTIPSQLFYIYEDFND